MVLSGYTTLKGKTIKTEYYNRKGKLVKTE